MKTLFFISLIHLCTKALYDIPEHLFNITTSPLYSYINLIIVSLIFIILLLQKKIYIPQLSKYFIFFSAIGVLFSILNNTTTLKAVANLYFYLMPATMLIYGYLLYEKCQYKDIQIFIRLMKKIWLFLFAVSLFGIVLTFAGYAKYEGFSSGILLSVIFFDKKSIRFWLGILVETISLKRTVIIIGLFILFRKIGLKYAIYVCVTAIICYLAFPFELSNKIINLLNVDIFDSYSLYLATGGRSAEWFAIFDKFSNDPISLFFGFGFGATYISYDIFNIDNFDERHYSHFLPMSYIFLTGIFSFIAFYFYLFKILFWSLFSDSKLYLLASIFILSSFAGSGLHVEPFPWLLFGYLLHSSESERKLQKLKLI